MRAEMKGDKKRIAELRERLDALPDETVVVTTAKVDKSGRIRPEHSGGTERAAKDDIAALVRAEREDQGDAMRVSEAALMKAASKNIIRGGGLDELFEGTASKRARREKIGNEDELERKRSKQIHRYSQLNVLLSMNFFKITSKLSILFLKWKDDRRHLRHWRNRVPGRFWKCAHDRGSLFDNHQKPLCFVAHR